MDVHLANFVAAYGPWVYALLFLIIFVETGVVVMPFLPGDSLLFVVGALCGAGLMSLPLSIGLLVAAAILGNQSNYTIGRVIGPKVFQWEDSRFFNRRAFDQAHAFYEKYGFQARVSQRYRSVFSTTVRNIWGDTSFTTIQPERLVDLQVGYGWESGALKGLSVLLQVNNATNEAYRTLMSVSDNTGAVPNLSYPAKFDRYGRQYLLGISYKM